MIRDPRCGHNRKKVNEDFFKLWTPNMAYVLGLMLADGAFEDVHKSSRTCYVQLTSTDKSLLEQVKQVMNSDHNLSWKKAQKIRIRGKDAWSNGSYNLRIGNKAMFQDLVNLGLVPKKAKRIRIPDMPRSLFEFFVRGYFDGDGCVSFGKPKNRKTYRIQVVFTSCCKAFLDDISFRINSLVPILRSNIHANGRVYQLSYSRKEALKVLSFMYAHTDTAPYLDRKYKKYQNYLSLASAV